MQQVDKIEKEIYVKAEFFILLFQFYLGMKKKSLLATTPPKYRKTAGAHTSAAVRNARSDSEV